jgi:type I restriction enzyme S subunit
MSSIDRFVQKHCPKGAPIIRLGDVLLKTKTINWKKSQGMSFRYIDLSSVDRARKKIIETVEIDSSNAPSRAQQIVESGDIIFGTTRPTLKRYCLISEEMSGQIASTGYCVLRPEPKLILPTYLLHTIGSVRFEKYVKVNQQGASYPSISDGKVKAFEFTLPPLEVQEEIVLILNKFTELEAELEEMLEAEIEARESQYKFYRNYLLTFDERKVPTYPLGEIGETVSGLRGKSKNDFTDGNAPFVSYVDISNNPALNFEVERLVKVDPSEKQNEIRLGDVLITGSSETKEDVGLTSVVTSEPKMKTYINSFCFIWRPNKNIDLFPNFSKHLFRADEFREMVIRTANGVTRQNLSKPKFLAIRIPIPPIKAQKEIAAILDKLESSHNEISKELKAEIEAVRQQYEYYRTKLLTFDELEVA